ncbi:ABC transporter permease [Streptomyces sp. PLAI1-29]|uniref:ABC transporter permease n=2 Tax=Streptomyces zingiberis TaxID=2053010 RepID=A0ABX1BVN5_9ACTN|nr:ABC transporter permease [Streptomyces zingiberis]
MGARFAFAGGREGWIRAVLTAVGVGLGAALLLAAASVPEVMAARDARGAERSASNYGPQVEAGPDTVRVGQANTDFRDRPVTGLLVRPDGDGRPPVPPGLEKLPATGEMAVSPALRDLLESPGSELLRERLDHRITAVIGDEGLTGPQELMYYAGAEESDFATGYSYHLDAFGNQGAADDPMPPELLLLVIIICVVLLLPVMIFMGTAVRFGGERRDRRLAALRLVGADGRMVRRIAAGEAMAGALLGLAVGGGLFLLLRSSAESLVMFNMSVFAADLRPAPALAALIVVAVPVAAVAVTLLVLRGVVIEPLGVVRSAVPRRRRLWWRLVLPALGLLLLLPLAGGFASTTDAAATFQVAAGTVFVLIGCAGLLPWLVESVVHRMSGGPVPWQLAVRRLQLSSGTAARAVSGITVAVAGAVALQMLFSATQAENTEATGHDTSRAQMQVYADAEDAGAARELTDRLGAAEGVTGTIGYIQASATSQETGTAGSGEAGGYDAAQWTSIQVADCASLRELIAIGSRCADGDVFVTRPAGDDAPSALPGPAESQSWVRPGTTVDLRWDEEGMVAEDPVRWTVPDSAREVDSREDPLGGRQEGIFLTPSVLDTDMLQEPSAVAQIRVDPRNPDAPEHVRNAAAAVSPLVNVFTLHGSAENSLFTTIKRGLFIGATATLVLIGASMILSTLEQLRERRRLLSVLVAFGTRRSTMAWSVLGQTALPVALGLILAAVGGLGLGAVLLALVDLPLSVDWASLALLTGAGAAVVLGVTALSMPPLWRMMRPEGLRTE